MEFQGREDGKNTRSTSRSRLGVRVLCEVANHNVPVRNDENWSL